MEINHPSYYGGQIECIDYIEDKALGFCLGNVIKYVSRAGKKPGDTAIDDLRKAAWYLNREISRMEASTSDREISEGSKIRTLSENRIHVPAGETDRACGV